MSEQASSKDSLKNTVATEGVTLGLEAEGCPPQLASPIAGKMVGAVQSSDAKASSENSNNPKQEQASDKSNEDNSATQDSSSGMVGMAKELGKLVAAVAGLLKASAQKATSALSNSGLGDSAPKANVGGGEPALESDALDTKPDSKPSIAPRP